MLGNISRISNFKGKNNTNGFAKNPENINRKGRPAQDYRYILEEAIKKGDYDTIIHRGVMIAMKKGKLSLQDLMNIQGIAFARWYYLTGGDMKRYCKIFEIK